MYLDKMTGALEAVLFAAGEPVSVAELADLLQLYLLINESLK